jgi:hypothetical protein
MTESMAGCGCNGSLGRMPACETEGWRRRLGARRRAVGAHGRTCIGSIIQA